MIRVTGEDLRCAVELFEQHAAYQQVRPCHRSEREHRVGAFDDGGPVPVGAADREGDSAGSGVAGTGSGKRILVSPEKVIRLNVSSLRRLSSARWIVFLAISSGNPHMEPDVSTTKIS